MAVVATVTEANGNLFLYAKQAGELGQTVTLTQHGKPYVVMMSVLEYETILDTMENLSGWRKSKSELRHRNDQDDAQFAKEKNELVYFFKNSPLYGVNFDLERSRDYPRDIEL